MPDPSECGRSRKTSLDRALEWCGDRASTGRNVACIWGAVLLLVWLLRSFLFSAAGPDEAEQLVHAQSWEWGYGAGTPPFFTWLLIAAQHVFGVTIAAVVFVKCALLGAAYFFLYKAARHVLVDRRIAALAALSPLAIYYAAWDASFQYTHSLTLVFSICLTFYSLLRLETRRDSWSYLWLGVAVGIGLLSKYNYVLFLAAVSAALCADPAFRGALLNRRLVLTAAVAAAAAAPHYTWLWMHRANFTKHVQGRFSTEAGDSGSFLGIFGAFDAGVAALNFLMPLLAIYILLFPRALGRDGSRDIASARHRKVLGRTFLIILAVTVAGVLIFDIARLRNHYMFLLILFPVYFLARVQAAAVTARALNTFAALLLALSVLVPVCIVAKFAVDPHRGSKSYYNMPYDSVARQLKAAGFEKGTIVADWLGYPIAGNLRPYFPESRVINMLDWYFAVKNPDRPRPIIPLRTEWYAGGCLLIWTPQPDDARRRKMLANTNKLLGTRLSQKTQPAYITAEMRPGTGRLVRLAYILFPKGWGDCR